MYLDFSTVIWSPNCEAKVWLHYFSNIAGDGAIHATVPPHPMVLCVRDHSDLRGKHHLGNFDHFFRTQSFTNHSISLALSASVCGSFLQCPILAILATPLIQTWQNLHRFFPQRLKFADRCVGESWLPSLFPSVSLTDTWHQNRMSYSSVQSLVNVVSIIHSLKVSVHLTQWTISTFSLLRHRLKSEQDRSMGGDVPLCIYS